MSGINDKLKSRSTLGIVMTGPDGKVKVNKIVPEGGEPVTDGFIITREFATANDFSLWVEKKHVELRMPRMDVIIEYCAEKDIDIEAVAPLINKVLKERIREEAENANMMRRSARLPL
jgi:hypothetical protein